MGGEDYRSWLSRPHCDWGLPKLNSLDDPLDLELGQPNEASRYMGSNANLISTTPSSLPYMQAGENKPHDWFYCFSHYQQTCAPPPSSGIRTQPPTSPYEDLRQVPAHNAGAKSAQKRFIVFDQSGDQKSLFVSSFTTYPSVQPLPSWSPAAYEAYNLSLEDPGNKAPVSHVAPTLLIGDMNENNGADAGSELHEDTDDLDALLYSDDSDDTEDDDEKSTGHSPSTMTDHDNSERIEGSPEDVDSYGGVTNLKRRKLSDGGYEVAFLEDSASASSDKPNPYVESNDDDAESSCAGSRNLFAGNKRMRNKKIRETVSALQSIIPSGKGGNAVFILDEAIQYLKSLKRKAKALGLN